MTLSLSWSLISFWHFHTGFVFPHYNNENNVKAILKTLSNLKRGCPNEECRKCWKRIPRIAASGSFTPSIFSIRSSLWTSRVRPSFWYVPFYCLYEWKLGVIFTIFTTTCFACADALSKVCPMLGCSRLMNSRILWWMYALYLGASMELPSSRPRPILLKGYVRNTIRGMRTESLIDDIELKSCQLTLPRDFSAVPPLMLFRIWKHYLGWVWCP